MRYRNDTAFDVTVHLDPPVVLAPGEEIDHDVHIIGLTRLDEDPPTATAEAKPAAVKALKKTSTQEAGQ